MKGDWGCPVVLVMSRRRADCYFCLPPTLTGIGHAAPNTRLGLSSAPQSIARLEAAFFPRAVPGPGAGAWGSGMASGAVRWLVFAPVRSVALRSGPTLKKDGGISAGLGGSGRSLVPSRSVIVTRSGAILPKPVKMSFGLLRVFSIVIPFLYVGTLISKNFAALLEEHDIFVPEDDDDDD